jgi:hypothetical protein
MGLFEIFRGEQKGLAKSAKRLKAPKRSILSSLKSKSRKTMLTLFTVLITSIQSFGSTADVQVQVNALMQRFGNGEVTQEEVASEFFGLMQSIEIHVREDIENRNYLQAQAHIKVYKTLAHRLGNDELKAQLNSLWSEIESSRINSIDMSKHGIYVDESNKIYFIGVHNMGRWAQEWARDQKKKRATTYNETLLAMLRERFPDLFNNTTRANIEGTLIIKLEDQGEIIGFVIEIDWIGSNELTDEILRRLNEEGSGLPFK